MSIEKVYDNVAKHYNQDLSKQVLRTANTVAHNIILEQIKSDDIKSLLALGIGDGFYIKPFKKSLPNTQITGLDISANMLKKAKENENCNTLHGNIADAASLANNQKFNLTLAHFVCAYVKPEVVLSQAQSLLNKDGYISVVTNTYISFPNFWAAYEKYTKSKSLIATQLKKHVEKTLETVFVPKDSNTMKTLIAKHQLHLIHDRELTMEVEFEDADALYDFFMQGGWFASGLVHPLMSPNFVRYAFKKLVEKHLTFPFRDTMNIAVILAQR